MYFTDEKDYIMRLSKEMVRVLFSLMLGKSYISVEEEKQNKTEVSGMKLPDYMEMVDEGNVNEAENIIRALCTVKVSGKTGVEMEALMGVNVALLTIYDMCKAMDRAMEIFDVHLEKKDGGKSGLFERSKEREQC